VKDLGEASYVIGIEIHRDRQQKILRLSQRAYIEKVLERFRMSDCKSSVAPITKGGKFSKEQCPKNALEQIADEKYPICICNRDPDVCSSLH
jgi:hypothetical protein